MVDVLGKYRREIITPSGEKTKQLYRARLDENGEYELVPDGIEDWYGKIQSYKESCLVDNILRRFNAGDVGALNQVQGFCADVSGMPTSMQEVLQMVNDGQELFNSLSAEVRSEFGNDFNQWFVQTGRPEWFSKMGVKAPEPDATTQPIKEPEVKE